MTLCTAFLALATALPILPPQERAPFAPASADMVIAVGEGGDSWTVLDVLRSYGQLTGTSVRIDETTREVFQSTPVGLSRTVVVPRDSVQSFVENLLVENDAYLRVLRDGDPRLVAVESGRTRRSLLDQSRYVAPEDLGAWRDHPAVLIRTHVQLSGMDVRQLTSSVRQLTQVNSNVQAFMAAGATDSVVLSGRADWVADTVDAMLAIQRASTAQSREPVFERFPLQHAEAAAAAPLVEELVRSSRPGAHQPQMQGQPPRPLTARVLADARTNALLVVADPELLDDVRALIRLVDVPAGD